MKEVTNMGSLLWEVLQSQVFKSWDGKHPSSNSITAYKTHAVKFAKWCRTQYGCRHFSDCLPHVQDYANHLLGKGHSASTVHTYLAGVCFVWAVPLSNIKKPVRHTADNTRSRTKKPVDDRADAQPSVSPRLFDFASMVGIRRHEYLRLRENNLIYDESGYLCVEVAKGKGGKRQLQRIMPGEELYVRAYFDGTDNYVFSKSDLNNKIDLHRIRARVAQRAYQYYLHRIKTEAEYAKQLESEIEMRWKKENRRCWNPREVRGNYILRGRNRILAKCHGLPLSYNRLATMAVSVFHLSHWRCDVTINNYLLATNYSASIK